VQSHASTPSMAAQLDQSGSIMSVALEMRGTYSTAHTMGLVAYPPSVTMEMILEWNVLVGHRSYLWNVSAVTILSLFIMQCSSSDCQQLYQWFPSSDGRFIYWGRQSRNLLQQPVGHCLWWQLGFRWCWCCMQAAGIFQLWLDINANFWLREKPHLPIDTFFLPFINAYN